MKQFRHLFVLDPLEKLNPAMDTSLRLAKQLYASSEHLIFACTLTDLFWSSKDKMAGSLSQELKFGSSSAEIRPGNKGISKLFAEFDCIHMRKDPPFDMSYLSATWLLDSAPETCLVVNRPSALQALNEKLASFLFPDASVPSFVSNNLNLLCDHILALDQDVIIKPLDLFGGRGIERIGKHTRREDLEAKLNELTEHGKKARIVQPFRAAVHDGEIRAFYAFGEAVNWCLKRPKAGSFLANTGAGASLHPFEPSSSLKGKIDYVSNQLLRKGVYLVGYDIIGEEISEINITSPRLLFSSDVEESRSFKKLTEIFEKNLLLRINSSLS